ncbi:hypothetical protein [Nitrososphaera sp.]|uniref:hypothetical protein n=1 Tax=Nitrososphaera sp. TaxID=1971748 RepID=UPI00307D7041
MSESDGGGSGRVEFRMLDHASQGDDTVSFKLEDGAVVKVKVAIERAGVATNYRNPDGSAHYAVNTSVKVYVIPPDKKFTIPKSQVTGSSIIGGGASLPADRQQHNQQQPSHIT